MEPRDDLISSEFVAYCLAKENELYAVYVETNSSEIKLNLGHSKKAFSVEWFNPRTGREQQKGSITSVKATGFVSLGNPPSDIYKDWLILLTRK
jgi:hypothetical protein